MNAFIRNPVIIFFLLIPLFLHGAEFQVKVIKTEADLPEKFCTQWKAGDLLVSDGKTLALIGGVERWIKTMTNYPGANAMGSIISIAAAGKNLESNLNAGSPTIRIGQRREDLVYASVKPVKAIPGEGPLTLEAVAFYTGKKGLKAEVKTIYRFIPLEGSVEVTSTLTNTGKTEFEELNYSLSFNALHGYSFSPFHPEKFPTLRYRIYQKKGHYLAWLSLNPYQEEEFIPGKLAPGETYETRHILLVDTRHERLLEKIYAILDIPASDATLYFKDFGREFMEVIISDALTSSVFFRSFLKRPFSLTVSLPEGTYEARAHFFPAVRRTLFSVRAGDDNSCLLESPPLGKVKVRILNSRGEFVPGKVTFIGLDPTESPYFQPENPVETGRYWETFKNSCFPGEDGLEVEIPAGTYLVYASRGPEYSLDQKVVEVLSDRPLELVFRVDRVVKTPGLISLDPHLHTLHSDGRMRIPERLRSVVAEGVDVAVASDHNCLIDYSPDLKKLGLNNSLAVITGNEVTTGYVIHYNTYPLELRPHEEGSGAINPRSQQATPLFEASRKKDPAAILQVNHPRSGTIGYFNNYQLDLESASSAWEGFDTSFDVLEILNGPYFYSSNAVAIEDWLHLLNRGFYFPLIGSSDSHGIDRGEPGYCRTYVIYDGGKGDELDWKALGRAILQGRSFATNGPIVDFKVNRRFLPGDTLTAAGGRVELSIQVQSAPWIAVDEVRLIVNGERRIIFPVKTEKEAVMKFSEQGLSLTLGKDSYLAVEVLGRESLFPVLQRASWSGKTTGATLPYAMTNPVFVDVDGNGRFDPPLPRRIERLPADSGPKKIVER